MDTGSGPKFEITVKYRKNDMELTQQINLIKDAVSIMIPVITAFVGFLVTRWVNNGKLNNLLLVYM
jgi:hypothetical protein